MESFIPTINFTKLRQIPIRELRKHHPTLTLLRFGKRKIQQPTALQSNKLLECENKIQIASCQFYPYALPHTHWFPVRTIWFPNERATSWEIILSKWKQHAGTAQHIAFCRHRLPIKHYLPHEGFTPAARTAWWEFPCQRTKLWHRRQGWSPGM